MILPARFRLSMLLALILCGQGGWLQAAPPANDNLAGAPILHATSTAAEASTTVEATMEGSEPFPPGYTAANYQGTVWWSWTPNTINPAGTWYQLETTGSAVDTVISLWTGTNFSTPLTLVHVNNDNPAIPADGTNSRIRFFAPMGATYRIAVASATGARGVVMLKGQSTSTSFAMVTAAALTPATVNVASAAQVQADVTIISSGANAEIASGLLTLYSPSNTVLATATVSGAANRISGTVANGVYRMFLNIPQGSSVGACRWGIQLTRASGAVSSYGWEGMTALPAGAPASITLINDPFAAWVSANTLSGPSAERAADPDSDGLENLIEYEIGTNPQQGAAETVAISAGAITEYGLPEVTVVGAESNRRLRIVYLRRLGDATVTATVQFSDNLTSWSNATQAPVVIATSATHEALAVEDQIFEPAKTTRYAKVNYVYTP